MTILFEKSSCWWPETFVSISYNKLNYRHQNMQEIVKFKIKKEILRSVYGFKSIHYILEVELLLIKFITGCLIRMTFARHIYGPFQCHCILIFSKIVQSVFKVLQTFSVDLTFNFIKFKKIIFVVFKFALD